MDGATHEAQVSVEDASQDQSLLKLEQSCNCRGVRSCWLCKDSKVREACGLHRIRSVPSARVGELCFRDADGEMFVRFNDGEEVQLRDLPVPFEGFSLFENLIDESKEAELIQSIESWPWLPSQSGRLKRDFGPRANFKKRSVKLPEHWQGFPDYAQDLLAILRARNKRLVDFEAVECQALCYHPDRGANHDLHIDDTWLWGERIVGVSLLGAAKFSFFDPQNSLLIRATLPPRSAYIIAGSSRYQWQHGFFVEDMQAKRLSVTYRELTAELLQSDIGQSALQRARCTAKLEELAAADHDVLAHPGGG